MKANDFIESRRGMWERLDALLRRSQGGVRLLSPGEATELGQLYRAATSDLALAKRDFPTHRVTAYLNQLVGRAHAIVYRSEPLSFKRLVDFVTVGFPSTYREMLPFTVVAALLFFVPALLAGLATAIDPDTSQWLLPASAQQLIPYIENRELWMDIPVGVRPYASTFIMQNNIRVSFLAFGGGMLAGLVTVWVMLTNGLLLGGLTGLTIHYGVGLELWSFVIGHGVIELSVVVMAGGTGLKLGWAILSPGLLRRRDALVQAGREAIQLLMGTVPLLMIAGGIEGFISPSEGLPWPVKWAVGIISGVLLYGYLLLAGRTRESPPDML